MALTSDWHIHTEHSCDGACMPLPQLLADAAARGMTAFGVTDHIHTPFNLPDLVASRAAFDAVAPPPHVHFGAEASVMSQWELDGIADGSLVPTTYGVREGRPEWAEPGLGLTREMMDDLGIEYVVGGTHWPLNVPREREAVIRDYHRQNMFLARHPLVNIVAHPWWWMGWWKGDDGRYLAEPWFDDFGCIPDSMHDEFAAALVENETCCEMNLDACLLNQGYPAGWGERYAEYLAGLKARGVRLTFGSDCHKARYGDRMERAERMLEAVGITDADLWRLTPREPGRPSTFVKTGETA